MKLRYLTKRWTVTREQVRQYHELKNMSMMDASVELQHRTNPTLQYWDEVNEIWIDVESVIEYEEKE
jgi:hypothetical protein